MVAVVVAEIMAEVVSGLVKGERREMEAGEHGCEVVEQGVLSESGQKILYGALLDFLFHLLQQLKQG